jgi:hypothetical protein
MRREQARVLRYGIGSVTLLLALGVGALVASGTTGARPRSSGVVTITYRDKGSTLYVHPGERLRVVLDNTYWTIKGSSDAAVKLIGSEHVSPRGGCVAGEGCGTVSASFRAIARGVAVITATRVSCGEALRCTNGNGYFDVTLRVS